MVLALASFIASICVSIYEMLQEVWQIVSSVFQVASATEATLSTNEISMWRSLWNDLFSQVVREYLIAYDNVQWLKVNGLLILIILFCFQVFRAVRSILNGFVAFFTACNRHRLRYP